MEKDKERAQRTEDVPCPCASLGAEERWGEFIGSPTVPPPPGFKPLQRIAALTDNTDLYRCPRCGTYFERQTDEATFLAGNSTWDSHTLTRSKRPAEELAVHEHVLQRDFDALARVVKGPDGPARLAALKSLVDLAAEDFDVSPLEPTLRELAASRSSEVQWAAARVLVQHFLRAGRPAEMASLLWTGDDALPLFALHALSRAARQGWPAAADWFAASRDSVWKLSMDADPGTRSAALGILETLGLGGSERERTISTAIRHLDYSKPNRAISAATHVLAAAARAQIDIDAALPQLGALLLQWDPSTIPRYESDALEAAVAGARRGANVAPLLPAVLHYVEKSSGSWPGRGTCDQHAFDILGCILERGVDITNAFGRLALWAESGDSEKRSRLLVFLGKAAERGGDLSAALGPLERLAARGGPEGELARGIQAFHRGRKQPPDQIEERAAEGQIPARPSGVWMGDEPLRTRWTWGDPPIDHCEVRWNEVSAWTDDSHGGAGTGCTLEEFAAGRMDAVSLPGKVRREVGVLVSKLLTVPKRDREARLLSAQRLFNAQEAGALRRP